MGEGDCDSDDECQGYYTCGTNNCDTDRFSQFADNDDCCIGNHYGQG